MVTRSRGKSDYTACMFTVTAKRQSAKETMYIDVKLTLFCNYHLYIDMVQGVTEHFLGTYHHLYRLLNQ